MAATLQDFSGPDSVKQFKCNFLIKYETHVGLNHGPSQPVSYQFSQQSAVKQLKCNSSLNTKLMSAESGSLQPRPVSH